MKRFLSFVCCALTLWLAMLVGVSQAQAQNLTVKFTFTDNTEQTFSGQSTLADAFAELSTVSKSVADVKELEVSAGTVIAQFWSDLLGEKANLSQLTVFSITDGVDAVADVPATKPFSANIETISIAKVKKIGASAFYQLKNLKNIDLPTVTTLYNQVFRESGIEKIMLPQLTDVGNLSFASCVNLHTVSLPEAITIGDAVFSGCSKLSNVNLPKVTTVGTNAFANCSALTAIELPKAEQLGACFAGCTNIISIKLPMATTLATRIFPALNSLKTLELNNLKILDINETMYRCDGIDVLFFPELTEICNQAITQTKSGLLKKVSMPKIEKIDGIPFYACYNLEVIEVGAAPPQVSIGIRAFPSQPSQRRLILVAPDGTPLTGSDYAIARANYLAVNDGDNTDELWYGWSIADAPYTIAATASPSEGGSVTGSGMYITGDNITLTATPAEGYRFLHWTDGVNNLGNENPYSFVASANADITAVFELIPTYNITATANPTEGGTVTGDGSYKHGETVSLTASPNSGYTFAGWYNGLTFLDNNSPYSFAATEAANIIAKFDTIKVTNITLDKTGTLLRKVGDTPVQITATIEPADALDKTITWTSSNELVATVADGLVQFVGVGYTTITATAASGVSASCIVNVNPAKYSITVDPNITNGEIMNSPSEAAAGDQVDLFVTPESGYQLVAGSLKVNGDASIVEPNGINQYKFSMPAEDVEVTAHFELIPTTTYAISIATDIENGTVVANPTKAAEGTPVTLTVTPDPNYQLVAGSLKYNGNDVSENAGVYTFIMPAEPVEITAQFEQMGYIINVTANPNEGGVVSGAGTYSDGETITITATPNAGYTFKQWNDNNTESSRSVVVSGNADYIAEFEEIVLNSISLNPASLTIPSTSILHYDFRVVFDPEDALNREFDWEISDPNVILNVSPYPSLISIAANNPGTATITVTLRANPNLVATCEVTVVDGDLPVQGVSLNQTSLTLLEGRAFQLKATTDPVAASNQKMTWTCTDESVVTINASAYYCLVVAKSAGTATVTVKTEDGGYEASCEITVEALPSVESIALNSTAVTLEVAETHLLQATVLPAEANQGVTWTSNNEAVATVVDGEITALAVGTAIITATTDDGGHIAHCVVNVNNSTLPDAIASFEDLTLVKADTFWTGASNPDGLFTSFVSGTYRFVNTSGWGGTYWAGFAYTNTTATDAASWNTTNVGTGIDGSQNYGVAYYSSWDFPTGITVERTNTTDAKPVSGMYVTNTAQVIDVLNNGNTFARKFEQGDWFKLTATADNGNSLDFYLADFRSSDATEHYIVDSWEWLDLSPLGDVKTVSFTMSSSDVGAYGVNTPTYFAFDDFGGVAPTFTLTYTAGPNGTVEGQQSVTQVVSYGKNGDEVLAEAAPGYQFLRWSDGYSWGNGSRVDYNVKENINVTAEFIPNGTTLHYISYFASPGGSIKGQTSQRVADGQSSIEVKAVANNGYRFDKWNDGNEQAARFESDVHQDDFYTAYFIKQIRVDYMAAANGRIEGKTTQIVDKGVSTEAVTAIANAGYRFVRWSDGVTEVTRTDIIDLDIDDTTFVAQFELIRHILTISVLGDDAQPIAAAKVTLGGKEYTTDAKGVVVDTLLPKTYAYTVELSGYNTQTGEVNLVRDTLVKVILSKPSTPATGLFDNVIESLSVYPNPTVGAVQVEANGMVMVYNVAGQLLQRVPAQGKVLIDLSSYPAGFYFVVVGKAKATIVKQ